MEIPVDINAPIWKTRSVGINLMGAAPDDIIVLNILYENKEKRRMWPHEYRLSAGWVAAYPLQVLKGKNVSVHIVPIDQLPRPASPISIQPNTVQKTSNNNLTIQKAMGLFDSKEIEDIRKENSERSGFDNRKKIPMGANVLDILDIRADVSKKQADMIIIKFQKDPQHREIDQYFVLTGPGSDIAKSKIIDWFERAFNYIIQPCQTKEELVAQLKQFTGKKVQGAIQYEKSLYTTKDGEVKIVKKANVWYVDHMNASMKVDINKCLRELSAKDIERVNALREMGKTVVEVDYDDEQNQNTPSPDPVAKTDTPDDLPF